MTRSDPTFWITKMVVSKGGQRVYDEAFHLGVNIIRGANSTGKSTIADLIFYGMGGDVTTWKDEAGSCDSVYVETIMNGTPITLRRDITQQGQQPMWVFIGDFETASRSATAGWQRYPYRRFSDRESFTQRLFRILDLPEVPGDAGANITMHQLLRLMYVDQMTPVDRIFRLEQPDSLLRRQAVGDLLCGVLDTRIYPAQLELREREREYENADRQLSALYRVLDQVENAPTVEMTDAAVSNLSRERDQLLAQIEELKSRRFESAAVNAEGTRIVNELKTGLDKVNRDIAEQQLEISQLELAIEDGSTLIREIERSLEQLKEGQATSEILGPLSFSFCPSCYSQLSGAGSAGVCPLCKTTIDPGADRVRYLRIRNELEIQLKESRTLLHDRTARLGKAQSMLAGLRRVRERLSTEYLSLVRHHVSDADIQIDRLTARLGYVDRELIELDRQRRLAEKLQALSEEKARLNAEIASLREKIATWTGAKERRQEAAYRLIQERTAHILSLDLQSEAEFTKDSEVYFNFAEDRISVAGKIGYSASSLTVIRNAFHLALLWASTVDREFKYPRFLLIDNIEDKGMTPERSRNLQKQIVYISEEIPTEHQIIFTTSMVDPELDKSDLVVGDHYTFENKSLKMPAARTRLI